MKQRFIVWQKVWLTNIKTIDDQHKHFVEVVNKVYALNNKKADKEKLGEILNDLIEYARVHFSTEEEYFEETDYPEKREHEEKHQELLGKVINFSKRFETKEEVNGLVKEFLEFLREWLDNHLVKVDHKYVPWLIENGIK